MRKKFGVLRVVATIFKVLAWIVLVVGILGACASIAIGAMPGLLGANSRNALPVGAGGLLVGLATGVGVIFFCILYFLLLYAFGDIFHLLIALEENTRLTAERLLEPASEAGKVTKPQLPPSS